MRASSRLLAFLLLSAVWLGGCTLLHPHRITNPNLPPGYKQQQRAARKAQKNSAKAAQNEAKARKKSQESGEDTSGSAKAADTDAASKQAASQASSDRPDKSTVKYDKKGLMKKPKLKRRHYYKPTPKPFRPLHRIRVFFHNLIHKHHGQPKAAPKSPADAPAKPTVPAAPADTGLTP